MSDRSSDSPVLNVPAMILMMILLFVAVHLLRTQVFGYETNLGTLLHFSFIPARYSNLQLMEYSPFALWWTPVTYSLLHADWTHLLVNSLWLLVFGGVVARRLRVMRFLLLCLLGSVSGALAHYFSNPESLVPTIGASAVVSACVGASVRFAFQSGLGISPLDDLRPRLSILETFLNKQTFAFIGVWFLVNYLSGIGFADYTGEGGRIAWEAHIGGFLAGLLLFALVDPVKPNRNPA